MRKSPGAALLLRGLALLALVVAGALLLARPLDSPERPSAAAPQDRPGPVLLVPGYGGSTLSLESLAGELRREGRTATVVGLPGDGTGDLRASAEALAVAAEAELAAGAPSVDVIGYSAGGLVARLWAREHPTEVRRVVTLGSPHHGTRLAAFGAAFAPSSCPLACQQLAPGSELLGDLNEGDETPEGPQWLSLWTTQDEVVTPPESARLEGAVNLALQDLCPGMQVNHDQLPTSPVVSSLVLQALSAPDLTIRTACPTT